MNTEIKVLTVLLAGLGIGSAHAAPTIPENCKAPRMEAMEQTAIPQILEIAPDAAKIRSIRTMVGSGAYEYYPGLWRINCIITVTWSNGTVDRYFKFSVWTDRYGNYNGSYGPQ